MFSGWSGKRDSNSRPRPWQGRALPTELFPLTITKALLNVIADAKTKVYGDADPSLIGSLAQSVEQLAFNQLVVGSNPTRPTIAAPW